MLEIKHIVNTIHDFISMKGKDGDAWKKIITKINNDKKMIKNQLKFIY